MKRRIIIVTLLALIAVAATALYLFPRTDDTARLAAERTREELKRQGYKIALSQFDLSTSPEMSARTQAIVDAAQAAITAEGAQRRLRPRKPETAFTDDGLTWQPETPVAEPPELERARQAILEGPIRFEVSTTSGSLQLKHLALVKSVAQLLQQRVTAESQRRNDVAFTNLLALTRLSTAWEPEPTDISHMVRFVCVNFAFESTVQALQHNPWTDEQLALLQREWETLDVFKNLPETCAMARANMLQMLQDDRAVAIGVQGPWNGFLQEFGNASFGALRNVWVRMRNLAEERRYREVGTYEDEKALLLYFRDREEDMKKAIHCPTWLQMREILGATNDVPFSGTGRTRVGTLMRLRMSTLAVGRINSGGQSRASAFTGRAAETETRKRLAITAIALERYRNRHAAYPKSLDALAPTFIKQSQLDFTDGKPLRYRLEESTFVLYSIGLDGVDDNGKPPTRGRALFQGNAATGGIATYDLPWIVK